MYAVFQPSIKYLFGRPVLPKGSPQPYVLGEAGPKDSNHSLNHLEEIVRCADEDYREHVKISPQ